VIEISARGGPGVCEEALALQSSVTRFGPERPCAVEITCTSRCRAVDGTTLFEDPFTRPPGGINLSYISVIFH